MVVSGGYFKKLTKSEYDDCVFVAGRFCTTLTHLVAAEHAESYLFSLYSEHDENTEVLFNKIPRKMTTICKVFN